MKYAIIKQPPSPAWRILDSYDNMPTYVDSFSSGHQYYFFIGYVMKFSTLYPKHIYEVSSKLVSKISVTCSQNTFN